MLGNGESVAATKRNERDGHMERHAGQLMAGQSSQPSSDANLATASGPASEALALSSA
jgi:hypothetical protein